MYFRLCISSPNRRITQQVTKEVVEIVVASQLQSILDEADHLNPHQSKNGDVGDNRS